MQIAGVPLCLFRACTLTRNIVHFPHRPRRHPVSPPPPSSPPSHRAATRRSVRGGRRGTHAWRGVRGSLLRKGRRDGTIISVDYAIIARPGGGGHLVPLTRPRGRPSRRCRPPRGYAGTPGIRSGPHGSHRVHLPALFPLARKPRGFRERNSSCAPTHRVTHLDVAVDIETRDLKTASDLSDKYKNGSSAKQVRRSSARRINALARSRDLTGGIIKFRSSVIRRIRTTLAGTRVSLIALPRRI